MPQDNWGDMSERRLELFRQIGHEADRGKQLHDVGPPVRPIETWLIILMEEVGEAAQAALEIDPLEFKREIIQCAAVCLSILEIGCIEDGGQL